MIDVPLMRKVLEHISEHPDEHDQADWAIRTACGTTYCFAGHTVMMRGHEIDWSLGDASEDSAGSVKGAVRIEGGWENRISQVAAYELGLDEDQQEGMFISAGSLADLWHLASEYTNGEIEVPEQFEYEEMD